MDESREGLHLTFLAACLEIYTSQVCLFSVRMCRISPACLLALRDNSLSEAAVLLTPTAQL